MAEPINVIVELSYSKRLRDFSLVMAKAEEPTLDTKLIPELDGINWDKTFPPVELPHLIPTEEPINPKDVGLRLAFDEEPKGLTYLVRGVVEDEAALKTLEQSATGKSNVIQVYADVKIESQLICPGSPAMGTDSDIEKLLCVQRMHECNMDGSGVLVAIVDTGFNVEYLLSRGKRPNFDVARSWAWNPTVTPGSVPVDHGTMCAYDACIAAPKCTLLDIVLLRPLSAPPGGSLMGALLSDAVLAYRHLLNIMLAPRRPGEGYSMVVNNSWGMFHPSWDFPVGHPGNYSDNPNHPFNRIVAALEISGADILFAAGNCGRDCPDGRCQGVTAMAIYGANSHPQVLSVGGVDISKERVGYSAIGPGRLDRLKPDICGYTHFRGSGVYSADGGTSAATPVVAGVVAAVRSKLPYDPGTPDTSPAAIRNMLIKTAEDRGLVGYDFEYGWGIVNGCQLTEVFCEEEPKKEDTYCYCLCCCHNKLDLPEEHCCGSKIECKDDTRRKDRYCCYCYESKHQHHIENFTKGKRLKSEESPKEVII